MKNLLIIIFCCCSTIIFAQQSGSFKLFLENSPQNQMTGTVIIEGPQNFQNDLENILIPNMYPGSYNMTIYYRSLGKNSNEYSVSRNFMIESGKVTCFSMNVYGNINTKMLLDPNSIPLCALNNNNWNNNDNNHHDNDKHGHGNQPPPPPPIIEPQPINQVDFSNLYNSIRNESFASDKIKTLKTTANFYEFFTSDQVRQLASLFSFESDKLVIVKYLVPKVLDYQNLPLLKDCFVHSSTKNEYLDYIRSLQR